MRLGTVEYGGVYMWGAITEAGFVDIGQRLPQFESLRAAISVVGCKALGQYLDGSPVAPDRLQYLPVIPDPDPLENRIRVGVAMGRGPTVRRGSLRGRTRPGSAVSGLSVLACASVLPG